MFGYLLQICIDMFGYLFGSVWISVWIYNDICSDNFLGLQPGSPVGCQRCILEAGPARAHVQVVITCSYPSRQRRARQGPQHRRQPAAPPPAASSAWIWREQTWTRGRWWEGGCERRGAGPGRRRPLPARAYRAVKRCRAVNNTCMHRDTAAPRHIKTSTHTSAPELCCFALTFSSFLRCRSRIRPLSRQQTCIKSNVPINQLCTRLCTEIKQLLMKITILTTWEFPPNSLLVFQQDCA